MPSVSPPSSISWLCQGPENGKRSPLASPGSDIFYKRNSKEECMKVVLRSGPKIAWAIGVGAAAVSNRDR